MKQPTSNQLQFQPIMGDSVPIFFCCLGYYIVGPQVRTPKALDMTYPKMSKLQEVKRSDMNNGENH